MPARTDRVPGVSTLIEDQNTVSLDCVKAAILYSGLLNSKKKKTIVITTIIEWFLPNGGVISQYRSNLNQNQDI